ncbi:calpain-1 catalytic subunit-like [Triplophysa dalaica]|uniref:calpain-1 catalytic subunit-like n=1 Tax=Triplophysa dalaica TaxID=1582913 RepID=UPI0024E0120D|nr:calpain-1 catalytic subunit-like [Triplophysa dalaica]
MPPPDVTKTHEDVVGSLNNPLKFLDQDYQTLHQSLLSKKQQFIDESFPANSSSIGKGLLSEEDMAQIKWKRPSEIVLNRPCLVVDEVSRFDYAQGSKLGDCWFLASIGAVSSQKDIMDQVIPAEQSFSKGYAGIFHFRFWRFGKWIDVVIDDQLPTINNNLIFLSSKIITEFWPALLEKAYAKVCGSFADLHGGCVSEALLDFTGGVHIHFDLKVAPAYLWNMMESAFKSKTLMGCSTPQGATSQNTVLPNGIVEGHAYTVTGVYQVTTKDQQVRLVRMFNPWGMGEWTGNWSDISPLWKTVSANDSKNCLSVADNGEFWMSMEDYTKSFKTMDICSTSPDFLNGSSKCSWSSQYHIGQWTAETAGGIWTIWKNPQFRVRIEKPSEDCAGGECRENILVSLMQNQENRHRKQLSHLYIGFSVYKIPPEIKNDGGKYSSSFFRRRSPVAKTDTFSNLREVMKFFSLQPGEYLIVPSTISPGEMASFVLSVFTKHQCKKRL